MSLAGKRVLITGASHGIGAAAAFAFAQAGSRVGIGYCNDRNGAEATAARAKAAGAEAAIFRADVSCRHQAEGLVRDFIDRFGGVDVLINNAGGALSIPPGGFEAMPPEYWEKQIDLNLNAAAWTARVAVGDMLPRRAGVILNISSIHAQVTWVKRKLLPYLAAKAGLDMLTRSLAVEMGRHGIRAVGVAPGFIQTKIAARYSEENVAAFCRKIPLGRAGTVDDVTPLLCFLADDATAGFITGQTFTVDGGQSVDGGIESMYYDF